MSFLLLNILNRVASVIIIITLLCELTESNISRECCRCVRPTGGYKSIMEGKLNRVKNSLCFYGVKIEYLICICTYNHRKY